MIRPHPAPLKPSISGEALRKAVRSAAAVPGVLRRRKDLMAVDSGSDCRSGCAADDTSVPAEHRCGVDEPTRAINMVRVTVSGCTVRVTVTWGPAAPGARPNAGGIASDEEHEEPEVATERVARECEERDP
uniref:Uncharacterized protein n=1 Tax=Coccolithus braarudii TaxID=221442 RepID=A0A6T7J2Z2_9EUKA